MRSTVSKDDVRSSPAGAEMEKEPPAIEPEAARRLFSSDMVRRAKLELVLETRAAALQPAVDLIVALLVPYAEGKAATWLSVALQELLRNAYEHGNLGITSSEKGELCRDDRLDEECRQREEDAVLAGKTIRVRAGIHRGTFTCMIEDDGHGFDWLESYRSTDGQELSVEELSGRGLLLIQKVFDSVTYNDKGNKVTVRKRLPIKDSFT